MEKVFGIITVVNDNDDEITPDKICIVCFTINYIDEVFTSRCCHNICKTCLRLYLDYCLSENIFVPITCPEDNCGKDIFHLMKYIVKDSEYKRLKSIRRVRKRLTQNKILWCKVPNCDGYAIYDNVTKGKCSKCKKNIYNIRDLTRTKILQDMMIIECPGCRALISKEILCVNATCYCGTKFCLKCNRLDDNFHQKLCLLKDKYGKIKKLFVLLALYAYLLFP